MCHQKGLNHDLWGTVCAMLGANDLLAFALVCKQFRQVQKRSGRKLRTYLEDALLPSDDKKPRSAQVQDNTRLMEYISQGKLVWRSELVTYREKGEREIVLLSAAMRG